MNTKKYLFLFLSLFVSFICIGQEQVEWDGKYELQFSDFKSPSTNIGPSSFYSVNTNTGVSFAFSMSSAEFMFTKNFNSKVHCLFNKRASSIIAPDSLIAFKLLEFARFEFDLAELYCRKFRKELYENKGAFSDVSFLKPLYDRNQEEYVARHDEVSKATELGMNTEKLTVYRKQVKAEIEDLASFCKTCKPPKKKRH